MFGWLETLPLSVWLRGEPWGWPLVLTLHSLGTALVIGFVFIVSLRMLGAFRLFPYASLTRFFPIVWLGLLLQIATGFLLWVTKPGEYSADGAFELKMLFMLIGVFFVLSLRRRIKVEAVSWDGTGRASPRAVRLAAAALVLWSGVLIASKLTAQLGSLIAG